jgi:hypothetical protein
MLMPGSVFAETGAQKTAQTLNAIVNQTSASMQQMQQAQFQMMTDQRCNIDVMNLIPDVHVEGFGGRGCRVLKSRSDRPTGAYCVANYPNEAEKVCTEKFIELAEQNVNLFEVYNTDGVQGSDKGVSCLEESIQDMQNMYIERKKQLTALKNQIDDVRRDFQLQADLDRNNIRKLQSLITGKGLDENELNDLYNKAFNDAQCRAMFTDASLKKAAKNGPNGKAGLEGILAAVEKEKSGSIPGAGVQGDVAEYLVKNQGAIRKDIQNVAKGLRSHLDKVGAKSVNSASNADGGFAGVSASAFNIADLPQYKNIVKTNFGKYDASRKEIDRKIKQLVVKDKQITNSLFDPDANFERELQKWKNRQYSSCINNVMFGKNGDSLSSKDLSKFASRFRSNNNRLSKSATRGKDLQAYIKNILSDNDISFDERIRRITNFAESKGYKDFYYFGASTTGLGTDTIRADGQVTAGGDKQIRSISNIFENYKQACDNVWNSREMPGSTVTAAQAYREMVAAREDYAKVAVQYQNNVTNDLVNTMINCNDVPSPGTCDRSHLSMSSNKFCVKHAVTCASNMNSCERKAQGIINKKTTEKKALASQYSRNFKDFKQKQFVLMKKMQEQVQGFSGFYSQYFTSPPNMEMPDFSGAKFDLTLPVEQFDKKLGVDILSEKDIKKYMDNLFNRYAALEKEVEKHNKKMIKIAEGRVKEVRKNLQKEASYWEKVKSRCEAGLQAYGQQMAKAQEQAAETNEKIGSFCNKYDALRQHPGAGCDGTVDELYTEAQEISGQLGAAGMSEIMAFKSYCAEVNNEREALTSEPDKLEGFSKSASKLNSAQACSEHEEKLGIENYCKVLAFGDPKGEGIVLAQEKIDNKVKDYNEKLAEWKEWDEKYASAGSSSIGEHAAGPMVLCGAQNNTDPGSSYKSIFDNLQDQIARGVSNSAIR